LLELKKHCFANHIRVQYLPARRVGAEGTQEYYRTLGNTLQSLLSKRHSRISSE